MKLNQVLMCAMAAGAMAFVSNQTQAVVIDGALYTPLNINATFSYIKAGKIAKATITSKTILSYLDYAKGTQLAVGPGRDVYAVYKVGTTYESDDLSTEGYFYFEPDEYVYYETEYTYSEAGLVTFDFWSDGFTGIDFQENDCAFILTGTYTYAEKDGVVKNGYYNQNSQIGSSNLGGYGYDFFVDEDDNLPVSANFSGSASGKVAE